MAGPKNPDKRSDEAPVSVRLPKGFQPKADAEGVEKHLDENGFAILKPDHLIELFEHDPDSVKRIAHLLHPAVELEAKPDADSEMVEPDLEPDVDVK